MNLNFDYSNALKLLIPESDNISLSLVGCGGTGSWLAPAIARIGKILLERGKEVEIFFVDPDLVEEKNIYRQNFCQAEIGKFKAETLAKRYGLAWGIEIRAIARKFDPGLVHNTVIIGCVDNAGARRVIANSIQYGRGWWLDCGNTKNNGQVLLGGGNDLRTFDLPGYCGFLPSPADQHPELLKRTPKNQSIDTNLSCAEMAMQDSQGLAINQRMAAEAADYLVRMLITKDLRKFATYIDLESGSCQSKYINAELVKEYLPKTKKEDRQVGCPHYLSDVYEDLAE